MLRNALLETLSHPCNPSSRFTRPPLPPKVRYVVRAVHEKRKGHFEIDNKPLNYSRLASHHRNWHIKYVWFNHQSFLLAFPMAVANLLSPAGTGAFVWCVCTRTYSCREALRLLCSRVQPLVRQWYQTLRTSNRLPKNVVLK